MQDEGEEPDNEGEYQDTNDEGATQQEIQDMEEERLFNDLILPLPDGGFLPVDPNMVQDPLATPLVVATTIPRQNNGLPDWGVASRGRGYRKKRSRKRTKRASKRRSKRVRRKTRRRKKSKRRR